MIYKIFIFILTIISANLSRGQFRSMPYLFSVYAGASIMNTEDCDCEFEIPNYDRKNRTTFGNFGLSFHTHKRLFVNTSIGFFKSLNTSSGINQHYPGATYGILEYNNRTFFAEIEFGIAIGRRKVILVPNFGFGYFRRTEQSLNYTYYVFYNELHTSSKMPENPDYVDTGTEITGRRWNATGLVIGLNTHFKLPKDSF